MWKKVFDYMLEYEMLEPGDRVIAAISGGADSVCLLSVLNHIFQQYPDCGWQCKVVHVHHGLRGGEADRDAAFVKALCQQMQIPCTIVYKDVPGFAREQGYSCEEAARMLRYQALEAESLAWHANRIALAHHKDDNAETILHHLLRGSAFRGLSGMRPVQGNRIRPLLGLNRADIIRYLNDCGCEWVEDSTNASNDYTRNRIRREIIPLLTETVNEKAADHIVQAGGLFAQADDYFAETAGRVWEAAGTELYEAVYDRKEAAIPLAVIAEQHPLIRSYLFGRMIAVILPARRDITARHYAAMEALLKQPVGSRISLPGGIAAVREYGFLRVIKNPLTTEAVQPNMVDLKMETFTRKKDTEIPKNQYTKWFDYDKIKGTLSVRTRKPGDYFTMADGGSKTIKRFMIDEKIPRQQRDQISLLAEGNHIVWIVGYRISEYYKITEDTKTILQVTCDGGEHYGR
ncbi:MAG: tRNA lysidine(34) synthetase TilS [Lachnospiraceae bacterium]